MNDVLFPKRKNIRLQEYDYSSPGSYFVTVCTKGRDPILWHNVGAATCRPMRHTLSAIGETVESAILQIPERYTRISVDKFCIMPDHIHLLITISAMDNGRQVAAPTLPTVIGQLKRQVSLQIGRSIWQKSFIDRVIRNDRGYRAVWEYIENNPMKLDTAYDILDFENM